MTTALIQAIEAGDLDAVSRTLARGVSVEDCDEGGRAPLVVAAELGDVGVVGALLGAGARADSSDSRGETPLHAAARAGRVQALELLVARRPKLEVQSFDGTTPLLASCTARDSRGFWLLLAAGAKPLPRASRSYSALLLALDHGHDDIARGLVQSGAFEARRQRGSFERSLLRAAVDAGNVSVFEALIRAGVRDDGLWCAHETSPMRRFLGWFGMAAPEPPRRAVPADGSFRAPFPLAVSAGRRGSVPILEALVRAGYDLRERDWLGRDALDHATRRGHRDCAEFLVARGLDPSAAHPIDRLPPADRDAQWAAVGRLSELLSTPLAELLDLLVCPLALPAAPVPPVLEPLSETGRLAALGPSRPVPPPDPVELCDSHRALLSIADGFRLVPADPEAMHLDAFRVLSVREMREAVSFVRPPRHLAPYGTTSWTPHLLSVDVTTGAVWDTDYECEHTEHAPCAESLTAHLTGCIASLRPR